MLLSLLSFLLTEPILSGRTFFIFPEPVHHTSPVCALTMRGLLDPVAVLESLCCRSLCQQGVSDISCRFGWAVMDCPGILALGPGLPGLTGFAHCVDMAH